MPLWTANDDPTGRPNYANSATVYGVDRTEAALFGKSISQGWANITYGTGSVELTLVSGGSSYTNASVITVDGVATAGVVNATANVIVGFSANVAAATVNINASTTNVLSTGANLQTIFANGDTIFVYTNSTFANTRVINQITNSTSMNVVGAWSTTNTAAAFGIAGVILTIVPNNGGGSGFVNTANVQAVTVGQNASVTATLTGRAGRYNHDQLVVFKGDMAGDAEDTIFPDS
jgi:hypothetical protein